MPAGLCTMADEDRRAEMQAEIKFLTGQIAAADDRIQALEAHLQQERKATADLVNSVIQEYCSAMMQERKMLAACFPRCAVQHLALFDNN